MVPLAVVHRRQHRLAAFAFIEGHAEVFVGEQLGAQHPDFLSIVARAFHFEFVHELHQVDLLAQLLRRLVTGSDGTFEVETVEGPEVAVVVAVGRDLPVGAWLEGRPLRQFAVAVRQLHAQFPRHGVVVRFGQHARQGLGQQRTALVDPGMVVLKGRVEQRTREPVEPVARRGLLLGLHSVQLRPERAHARKAGECQRLDPRVFHQTDQRHLPGAQRLGRDRLAREHHVRRGVCGGGAVELRGVHRAGIAFDRVVGVGQVDEVVLDEGAVAITGFKIAGGRLHVEIAPPERAQVHVDAPLHVHQQRALALLLQHGQRLFGLQAEVGDLFLVVRAVRLRAPGGPAPQAAQRELAEQRIELAQHGPQVTRRLSDERVEELQVLHEQRAIGQAARGGGRGGQHQLDHRTRGLGCEHERGGREFTDHVFADLLRHLRRAVDPGVDELVAPAQAAQRGGAFHVVVQSTRREHLGRVRPAVLQQLARRGLQLVGPLGVVVEVDAHDKPLQIRRTWPQRRRVRRACPGRR